jgi:L-cysteine S-thiosulfotransferase
MSPWRHGIIVAVVGLAALPMLLASLSRLPPSWSQAEYDGGARAAEVSIVSYTVVGDAIPAPLANLNGNAEHGRRLVLDRETGNCLICHQVPIASEPSQGDLAPSLAGVGARLTPAQIRFRLVDQSRLNPATLMPSYYRVDGLTRVAGKFKSKPVFDAQQIEDVVAWLATLKD